jgi:hypothetical protein
MAAFKLVCSALNVIDKKRERERERIMTLGGPTDEVDEQSVANGVNWAQKSRRFVQFELTRKQIKVKKRSTGNCGQRSRNHLPQLTAPTSGREALVCSSVVCCAVSD